MFLAIGMAAIHFDSPWAGPQPCFAQRVLPPGEIVPAADKPKPAEKPGSTTGDQGLVGLIKQVMPAVVRIETDNHKLGSSGMPTSASSRNGS